MDKSYLSEEARRIQRMRPFNVLQGRDRKFAKMNGLSVGEYTIRAIDVRKARKTDPLSMKAGDGNFGFSIKRPRRDDAKFVQTLDGTGLKKARATATRPRKMPCLLATRAEVHLASLDPVVRQEREKSHKKAKRAKNRNHKAKYGRKD
jgi:hypothetical protein